MARRAARKDGLLQKKIRITVRGESKQFVVYGHSEAELTKKENAKREQIEREAESRNNPTVSEYYAGWKETRRGSVRESTLRGQIKMFNAIADVYIPSARRTFGELKIKDVEIDDLRVVQSKLLETRRTQTTNDYMAHFKHCMSDALKERMISYNPCVLLKNLKRTEEAARDTIHRALSQEEQAAFFGCERCKQSYYYNIFRFAILTGMRIGEIGALKHKDIRSDVINVERTITRTETGAYVIGDDAKTRAGRRSIPMNEQIKEVVASQKEINSMLRGNVISINDLIFVAPEGGLLMSTPADREIKRICKITGIEPFTMHAFRDTFATRAIESGMNPKTLQEILGHSNFNITMSLYGHCLEDTKKKEMDAIKIVI